MSLADRMAGALSANKPIDAEFCRRIGGKTDRGDVFNFFGEYNVVSWYVNEGVWVGNREMKSVNTQGRFLHLLAALGIEVPS